MPFMLRSVTTTSTSCSVSAASASAPTPNGTTVKPRFLSPSCDEIDHLALVVDDEDLGHATPRRRGR